MNPSLQHARVQIVCTVVANQKSTVRARWWLEFCEPRSKSVFSGSGEARSKIPKGGGPSRRPPRVRRHRTPVTRRLRPVIIPNDKVWITDRSRRIRYPLRASFPHPGKRESVWPGN